jgi:hypothetical protein
VDSEQALEQIVAGAIDPRRTVALEQPPPPLGEASPESDQASIIQYSPETIQIGVQAAAPAMLILSDIAYPAWRASVDDTPTQVYIADAALRAVAVPAGKHTVELHYTSAALPVGAAITSLSVLLLAAALVRPNPRW